MYSNYYTHRGIIVNHFLKQGNKNCNGRFCLLVKLDNFFVDSKIVCIDNPILLIKNILVNT